MIRSLHFRELRLVDRDLPEERLREVLGEPATILWVDLCEPSQEEAGRILEGLFQFHPLTVEDCLTETPYPKLEDFGDYLHIVMHEVRVERGAEDPYPTSDLDIFVSRNYLVTFQRVATQSVAAVFERAARGTLVFRGPDRLAHAVIDQIVENYKHPVAELRDEVERIGEGVLREPRLELIKRIIEVRKELSEMRGIIQPQQALLAQLIGGRNKVVRPAVLPYLRDLQDDLTRLREQTAAAQDQVLLSFRILLNRSSFEANQGIKILTALTAIALPMMIISTWFAMNFEDMPFLGNPWAYPIVTAVTVFLTILTWIWLKRKGCM
jgi:magnesium transporter